MTSSPAPGIPQSLQHRGAGGPPRPQVRRQPSKPINRPQNAPPPPSTSDLTEDTAVEGGPNKSRNVGKLKARPGPLEGLQTGQNEYIRPPPKGRPQLFFSTSINNGGDTPGVPLQSPHSNSSNTTSNMPNPPRPGGGDASQNGQNNGGNNAVTKHSGSDSSAPAAALPGGKTADLFPWTGNHPEDTLSEALVKGGICNKPQIMNETNTARPSLWSNLKNKSGLSTLSSLFVAVLEKRQQCGRLTAPNTFKPPPRLTLRESLREAWLHDLANPAVSLRRLSRTIPHGITGKVLMEQCLNKNIPIPRAIWLAKCVGINEMRSHKRKGQAGTITWVKGWTTSVEQFLDTIIATIGQKDWKPRITYALELVTQLYKERLLEEDHFLDWLLKSLDTSSTERLFLWLLLISVYWQDLTACRRRGKRLAESLLVHAERLNQNTLDDVNTPIRTFLENVITKLLVTRPPCLLLPKSWSKYGSILHAIADKSPDHRVSQIFADLDRRNKRLSKTTSLSTRSNNSSRKIISLLDSIDYSSNVNIDQLSSECVDSVEDPQHLISFVLQWASSIYRDGAHRVYLATRLLRKWSRIGFDIDDAVLGFLHSMGSRKDIDPRNVFRVVAELVRSKSFSVGKYLQWLIATGSLNTTQDFSTSAWPIRLITEIPLSGLSEQVLNLRATLLQGCGYPVDSEDALLDEAQDFIQQQIPNVSGMDIETFQSQPFNISSLSTALRFELSIWLRQLVSEHVQVVDRVPTKTISVEESAPVSLISLSEFHTIRSYLEEFGDISILADVLGVVTTSLAPAVLISVADTLHFHQKALSAIGAFKPLFQKIATRYATLRTIRALERDFLLAVTDLARAAHAENQLMQLLHYDLSRCEQKNSLAACSPVSDTMTEALHNPAMDVDDEIDRILTSGTSMDPQIMSRVFNKITLRLEEQAVKGSIQSDMFASWFFRLRCFDEKTFDNLLGQWLSVLLVNHQGKLVLASLPPLVASGALSLVQFLAIARKSIESRKNNVEGVVRMCLEVLNAVLPADHLNRLCSPQDSYRYRLEQQKFSLDQGGHILSFLRQTIELCSTPLSNTIEAQMSSLLTGNRLRSVIKHFAVTNSQTLAEELGIGSPSSSERVPSHIKSLLDGLLDGSQHLGLSKSALEDQVATIVDIADEFSLPYCQLELRQIFCLSNASTDTSEPISAALLEAIKTAVSKDRSSWSDLVAGLDGSLSSKIREHAEREIFSASTSLSSSAATASEAPEQGDDAVLRRYLTVVDFTSSGPTQARPSQIFSPLVDRLKGIVEVLNKQTDTTSSAATIGSVCLWLNAFLHLAVVHTPVSSSKAGNQNQAAFLWTLRSLLNHPSLASSPSVTEYIFDVGALFSDFISDEVRNRLAKMDATKPHDDPRTTFLFGSVPPPDAWLGLVRPTPPAGSSQATGTVSPQPGTPAQTASPSPTPNQGFQSASPSTMQRSLSQQQQQQQQGQTQNRMYPQYPQHGQQQQKGSSLNRMPSFSNQQQTQLQQVQAMQNLAQQRSSASSPIQRQQNPSPLQQQQNNNNNNNHPSRPGQAQAGSASTARSGPGYTDGKIDWANARPVPFRVQNWDIIPESGGTGVGNETAISLSLFGARRV